MKSSINLFSKKKRDKKKITMLTCYDYTMAKYLGDSEIDSILIGDSMGMVFQGKKNTFEVSIEDIAYHSRAVKRGAPEKFIVADMPYLSYHISVEETIRNGGYLIQNGRANAVKVEGGTEVIDKIVGLIGAKIPVMGHLGLTPQSINIFGGYRVQGKSFEDAEKIIENAIALEKSGVFAIVLECVPTKLAEIITEKLAIPTIGIGSGNVTDGQVLVINDILGMFEDISPKFVKRFVNVGEEIKKGITGYIEEVENTSYPSKEHTFTMDKEIVKKLQTKYSNN